jgi:RNA polymerase primary sigma factor
MVARVSASQSPIGVFIIVLVIIVQALRTIRCIHMENKMRPFVPHPCFDDPAASDAILGPMPGEADYRAQTNKLCPQLPAEFRELASLPPLNKEQEQHLFRKMNLLKYKADMLSRQANDLAPAGPPQSQVDALLEEADTICNRLVAANVRLVIAILKKFPGTRVGFTDLLSDGTIAVFQAVLTFDFSRGYKFSTYAARAVKRQLWRSINDNFRYRKHRKELDCAEAEAKVNQIRKTADVDPATKAAEQVQQLLATL